MTDKCDICSGFIRKNIVLPTFIKNLTGKDHVCIQYINTRSPKTSPLFALAALPAENKSLCHFKDWYILAGVYAENKTNTHDEWDEI